MHYDDALWRWVFEDTTLVNVNDNECMKANTCMLLRVMCKSYIRLCHKYDLKMKTIGTSCILCVHIHRPRHSRDTTGFSSGKTFIFFYSSFG